MSWEFLLTSLVIVASPGTGVLITLTAGLTKGRRAAIIAALGGTLGIIPHMVAAITGLAAVLHTSAVAFDVISKSRGKPSFIGMIMNAFRPKPTTPAVLSQSSPNVDADAATPVGAGSTAEPRRAAPASSPKGDADTD